MMTTKNRSAFLTFHDNQIVNRKLIVDALFLEVVPNLTLPVAQIGDLIVLKILASSTERPQDQIDLESLLKVAKDADLDRARWTAELIMQRGTNRERDLVALLRQATGY
ncbi:hypothetical protein FRD01_13005 [Microvenator marinus]|uniref:Uncharacterized protein n=1 Tax=Microvenator marinus TaxID=2600177 RepID=A0A5B8XQG5_9DELT|nr:hypothetical protein [Microvenator marinus]QED28132.1 hypothetical protein FRD01_13005 [Microvenator marinus]